MKNLLFFTNLKAYRIYYHSNIFEQILHDYTYLVVPITNCSISMKKYYVFISKPMSSLNTFLIFSVLFLGHLVTEACTVTCIMVIICRVGNRS